MGLVAVALGAGGAVSGEEFAAGAGAVGVAGEHQYFGVVHEVADHDGGYDVSR